ncbi:hypothetical protein VTO42DRAFT_3057 [Malbranchea cinnamomea]
MAGKDDPLAYGYYPGQKEGESERGFVGDTARGLLGDTLRKFRDKYDKYSSQSHSSSSQQRPPEGYPGGPPTHGSGQAPIPPYQQPQQYHHQQQPPQHQHSGGDLTQSPNPPYHDSAPTGDNNSSSNKPPKIVSSLLGKIQDIGSEVAQRIGSSLDPQAYATYGGPSTASQHRYGSFAPERSHNNAKWYVDGCTYMWAVSRALETARESIWILDWWLSPELYLRRPPSKNEQYRLDRMLQAAAQRGVKVNIIVYKEVTQALTLCSHHTKHHLQNLHPNIAVFRYPDHLPDRQTIHSNIVQSLQNMTLNPAGIAKLSAEALKAAYGSYDDVILYWAHHEKLCLVDGKTAFMGGLDLCYGRWDTYQHSIADVHPGDIEQTVFPGQDYNNARILDFQDVVHWENNQLDRKVNSRMGWADVAVSLQGPVVEDLRRHFVERWNYIYDNKYAVRKDSRYSRLVLYERPLSSSGHHHPEGHGHGQPNSHTSPPQQHQQWAPQGGSYPQTSQQPQWSGPQYPPPPPGNPPQPSSGYPQTSPSLSYAQQQPYFPPPPPPQTAQSQTSRGFDEYQQGDEQTRAFGGHSGQSQQGDGHFRLGLHGLKDEVSNFGKVLRSQLAGQVHQYQDRYFNRLGGHVPANMSCQIVRSCSKWSIGKETEHSIADAYCQIIRESEHFIYIENQFFITATGNNQKPVKNQIGAAIVERILRAARAGQKYKVIVVIPSVPGFAGDLAEEGSLGTRAIMEFQYESINRGGHSILETIAKEGYNPMEYIRFYNLRNYDRINASAVMKRAEQASGVKYGQAQQGYDAARSSTAGARISAFDTTTAYPQYQQAAKHHASGGGKGRWDTVSECYMLGGEDIRNVPWEHGDTDEIDAFVSEELYVHSKVLIADDRTVICGSANINDRSQLGYHDSEIAVIIQDPDALQSTMNGQPYPVSRFAATLRRFLCRKHLGLIPIQDYERPDANFEPVGVAPNAYDFGSPEDRVVADPLSSTFLSLWNSRAKTNTEVYRKVFHVVPDDNVRTWADYKEFYEYYFRESKSGSDQKKDKDKKTTPARYQWGHVVAEDFPGGVAQVKEELAKIKGTLVEMPLMFLIEEDIAKEGLGLNSLTEEIYT